MWARCFSSRRTSPFSAMIWRTLRTVVYCVGFPRALGSCTVDGPRLQRTVRISSSASVGRGGWEGLGDIYEDCTTKSVVESRKSCGDLLARIGQGQGGARPAPPAPPPECGGARLAHATI